jgi:MazG family protein
MKLSRGPGQANQNRADAAARSQDGERSVAAAHGLRPGVDGLRDLMDRLLAEDGGCPWDRAQTLETLEPFLVEETYEVLEALRDPDPEAHRGELGDLLFQIVFQSALREREGAFDLDGVAAGIVAKLVRRHPHVFGPDRGEARTAADVERQWSEIKARERGAPDTPRARLARVPRGLPSLPRAARLQQAAASVGFDWPDVDGAIDKLAEECRELSQARREADFEGVREELGDMLFVVVRIAQKLGVDPDDALRRANAKFERRFEHVLARCEDAGIDPSRAGLEMLEGFWTSAKEEERAAAPSAGAPDDPTH